MNLSTETLGNIRELLKDEKYRMPREIALAIVNEILLRRLEEALAVVEEKQR